MAVVEAGVDVLLKGGSVVWLALADEHALITSIIKNMVIHRKIISFPHHQVFSLVNYTYEPKPMAKTIPKYDVLRTDSNPRGE